MADQEITFDAPPVVEVVLGVQFDRLSGFSAAHAGWFWRELPEDWQGGQAQDAPRLDDASERFGDEQRWAPFGAVGLQLRPAGLERVQIIHPTEDRMIQVQDSRLIYNWRKRKLDYPRYSQLRASFEQVYDSFGVFTSRAQLPGVTLNQWEVTYVNHIPKGDLWETPEDWQKIVPSLQRPLLPPDVQHELQGAEWRSVLGDRQGRLYIFVRHGRLPGDGGADVLVISCTARGPVVEGDYLAGFERGHSAIVNGFALMTSREAHRHWKRRL